MKKIACSISYSHYEENIEKFEKLRKLVEITNIDYSERVDKSQYSDQEIWEYLHKRIAGSSCTILLLTKDILTHNKNKINYVPGNFIKSGWIYNELSASLRNWENNRINGLVCVVDDYIWNLYDSMLPEILEVNKKYIIFVNYSNFIHDHENYIHKAINNRKEQINSSGKAFKIVYDLHNRKSWYL